METLKTERAEIGEAAAPIAKTAATNRETLSQALYQSVPRPVNPFEEKQSKLLQDARFAGKIPAMERQLKDNQMRTLRFIYDYIKGNDCAPTRKEIAKALGVCLGTVQYRITYLFDYSYLTESDTSQWGRNIALTEKGIRACETLSE